MAGRELGRFLSFCIGAIMTRKSDEIRLRYLYRRLILTGKVRLSFESARGLIGPDCAYHLYGAADFMKDRGISKK
jgi:hypothetical protein